MRRSGHIKLLTAPLAFLVLVASARSAEDLAEDRFYERILPILEDNCFSCHGLGMNKGNVSFDEYESEAEFLSDRTFWHAVLSNVRAGTMPPADQPRPSEEDRQLLVDWIKFDVFEIDPEDPDPGHVTIRRLNRVEYRNTIRDLMGIDFNTFEEFPPDDTGYGFDTIGDVLNISPLLLEKYLQAAETIVERAVPTVPTVVRERRIPGRAFRTEDDSRADRLSYYEDATISHTLNIERAGDYRLKLDLNVSGHFDFEPGRCEVAFFIDGEERFREEFAWHNGKRFPYEFEEHWDKGEVELTLELKALTPDARRNFLDLRVAGVELVGPLDPEQWVPTENYDRFFFRGELPESDADRRDYARAILERYASKAYRRPVDEPTLERLVTLAEQYAELPEKRFEDGVARALTAILASPRFVFRIEQDDPKTAQEPYPYIDEYSLASRLSYFLWSTMPDDELFELAEQGELRANLDSQVERMLKDRRSNALIENFTGQWLQVRDVEGVSINSRAILRRDLASPSRDGDRRQGRGNPNVRRINFDRALRLDLRRETERYVAGIFREDRSLVELIDSDYTYLNERLAEFYDVPDVSGDEFQRVTLPEDSPRGGVLTQGAILSVTSNPTRTSPVKRGLFLLENILGTPPPPAPPDIPELEEAEKAFEDREPTMREIMAVHRESPLCNSCHSRMDPLGLALENFNAMGLYRDLERGEPIDTSGQLVTGEPFEGIRDLKRILATERRLDFYRCITEKLLIYALGRGLEDYDVQTVDQIVERLEANDGRASTLLIGVIESAPFQKRRNPELATVTERRSEPTTSTFPRESTP